MFFFSNLPRLIAESRAAESMAGEKAWQLSRERTSRRERFSKELPDPILAGSLDLCSQPKSRPTLWSCKACSTA